MTNLEIAELLRKVAAAYQILGENRFKIIAYERAADSIEQLTGDVRTFWKEGKLSDIPGVGAGIAQHLDDLFKTGSVPYIEDVLNKLPRSIYPLLLVPGIGPKKAFKLVTTLKLDNEKTVVQDLAKAAKNHQIAPIEGFGEKSEADIVQAIDAYRKGQIKENRMELPLADVIAQDVMAHMKKLPSVTRIDVLGSLRRKVATIGDIDMAVITKDPDGVLDHFLTYPHQKLIERGPTGASILLHNGRQVDLRVQKASEYGAMLQYFTGSKNHNIKLRSYALTHGKSLNEYGIKDVKSGRMRSFQTEEAFYKALGMPWIPPELREDKGEIEAALRQAQGKTPGLPDLIETSDIKGDLHMHTSYDLESSHDVGANTIEEHLDKAVTLGYSYIGISDHNPRVANNSDAHITAVMKKRYEWYTKHHEAWQKKSKAKVGLFVMCEVDILPDGSLALPTEAFDYVDAVVVSLHSSFAQDKNRMTERVIRALTSHPKVRIFGHPTGRLLTKRDGVELDWQAVFDVCKARDIALEINAAPSRLDLPDTIVYDACKQGLTFCIDTDSHAVEGMDLMQYGVSVARRGWAETKDIVNAMEYNEFKKWLCK